MYTPWKSTAAGIFDILAGICALLAAAIVVLFGLFSGVFVGIASGPPAATWEAGLPIALTAVLFGFGTLVLLALGFVALWGGVHAVRKQSFAWSVAASVATMLIFFPVGLVAVVLTLVAEPEFPGRQAALQSYQQRSESLPPGSGHGPGSGPSSGPSGGPGAALETLPNTGSTASTDGLSVGDDAPGETTEREPAAGSALSTASPA